MSGLGFHSRPLNKEGTNNIQLNKPKTILTEPKTTLTEPKYEGDSNHIKNIDGVIIPDKTVMDVNLTHLMPISNKLNNIVVTDNEKTKNETNMNYNHIHQTIKQLQEKCNKMNKIIERCNLSCVTLEQKYKNDHDDIYNRLHILERSNSFQVEQNEEFKILLKNISDRSYFVFTTTTQKCNIWTDMDRRDVVTSIDANSPVVLFYPMTKNEQGDVFMFTRICENDNIKEGYINISADECIFVTPLQPTPI